jgi:hypothetical protein
MGADGITISGGEPLAQWPALTAMLRRVAEVPGDRERTSCSSRRSSSTSSTTTSWAPRAWPTSRGEPTGLIWRDREPDRAPLQLLTEHDGFLMIGVPRRGALQILEGGLRLGGLPVDMATWSRGAARGAIRTRLE